MDVRSTPYSRFHPQFNKERLAALLAANEIAYVYEGASLGGRPSDPTCYVHGVIPQNTRDYHSEISYPLVMQRPWFIEAIQRLVAAAGQHTTCILCSEGDPAQCHRHHLIAAYLRRHHPEVEVQHILKDGNLLDARSMPTGEDDPDVEQISFLP